MDAVSCRRSRHQFRAELDTILCGGETTPEEAHKIGMELAGAVLGGKYEFVLTTHVDKDHLHNHLIFNAVSFVDYKKYHSNKQSYHFIRRTSDKICKEHGLSVVVPGQDKGLKTPVFLRLPARGNSIDDTLYSNPQKRLSNCPRKDKKRTGARCRKSATAPLFSVSQSCKPCRSSKSFSCPRKPPRRNGGKHRLLPAVG